MPADKNEFRHESIQDRDTIRHLLKAITKGVDKGELSFQDEDGEILLRPQGLLNLKLTASREDGRNRLTLRITWQEEIETAKRKRSLKAG